MQAKRFSLWIASAVVALGGVALADNTLNCTLTDSSGSPAQKIEVVLKQDGNDKKEWKKKTNDKGEVQFKGLPDGTFRLQGSMQGMLLTKASGIELAGNSTKTCSPVFVSVDNLNKLLSEAMEATKQSKNDLAVQKAKEAVELAPSVPQTHNMLAIAYARSGMMNEAMDSVKKAASMDKQFEPMIEAVQMEALGAQASQALSKQDFDGAIAKYKEIASLKPSEPSTYYNMALAYGHKGDFDNALKSIDKAIELKPDDQEFRQRKIQLQDLYMKQMDQKLEKKP